MNAIVYPDIEDSESHRPYDRGVTWSSSDPAALMVDTNGNLTVNDGAPWILEALSRPPYQAEKTVDITAMTRDGMQADRCRVTLKFQANCIEAEPEKEVFSITLTLTGRRSAPVLTYSGQEPKPLKATIYSNNTDLNRIVWSTEDPALVTVLQDGTVAPVLLDENNELKAPWIRKLLKSGASSGTKRVRVNAASLNGKMKDSVWIELNFKVIDPPEPPDE